MLSASLGLAGDQKKQKLPPIQSDALHGEPPPTGLAAVGWRVAIWWKDDECYYKGRVVSYDPESGTLHGSRPSRCDGNKNICRVIEQILNPKP